jgi:hypothetical protein
VFSFQGTVFAAVFPVSVRRIYLAIPRIFTLSTARRSNGDID